MSVAATDAAGREHARAGDGARIVSLVPSVTELLFALGLGARLVGRTTFCIHPADGVAAVPRVGGTKTPDLDRIAALGATHAVVNVDENRREHARALEAMGVEVVVTHPCAPADNPALYRLVGAVFARERAAETLCGRFDGALAALREAARSLPRRTVLYLIWRDPWRTVSRDTYVSRMLAEAGLYTAAHDPGRRYPEIALGPGALAGIDAVLLSSEPYPFKPRHVAELRAAVGDDRVPVAFVDGEMTSWYGSRAVDGCAYLARFAATL